MTLSQAFVELLRNTVPSTCFFMSEQAKYREDSDRGSAYSSFPPPTKTSVGYKISLKERPVMNVIPDHACVFMTILCLRKHLGKKVSIEHGAME